MSALADKIRKAREVKVEADGLTFIVRRPTDLEMIDLRGAKMGRAIINFIVGWEGVTELSLTGTGAPHPLDFDADACGTWLEDRLDITSKLVESVFKAYAEHQEKQGAAVKN
jgi:hypothetical protein